MFSVRWNSNINNLNRYISNVAQNTNGHAKIIINSKLDSVIYYV